MSKCDLSIRLEDADRVHRPGERVRGELSVEVNAPCRCSALTVSCRWRTHGRGNRDQGMEDPQVLFQGELAPGMSQRYPFEFTVPPGPATYHGKLLNVDWYVMARADIPWAIDPKAEAEFLVEATEVENYDFGTSYAPPEQLYRSAEKGLGCKFAFLGVFLVAGGLILGVGAAAGEVIAVIVGGIFMSISALAILGLFWRGIAQRKLGAPEVRIGASVARPGDMVPVSITIRPRAALKLEGVTAALRCSEVVVSGSGTNKHTHRQVLHQSEAAFDPGGRELPAGEEVVAGGVVEIPPGAPPTFAAPENKLEWVIALRIGIAGWPDWKRDYPVSVRP